MAVGKVNGVTVGNEVFVLTVTLYGKAGIQYVINGSGIVALACQVSAAVTGRVGYGIACISQVALHIGQCSRLGGVAGRILHAGNYITGRHFVTACRCIIEFAVGSFVHLRAVGFGVYNRKLGILYHRLGIQCIGVRLVTVVFVYLLFYSQSVTGFKGYFLTRLNGGRCSVATAGQITARCSLETAVVDCFGNIARCNQFACIILCRRSHFSVGYSQRSGIGCHFIGGAAGCVIHSRGNGNTVTSSYLGGGCFELVYINRICTISTFSNISDLVASIV